MSDRKPSPLAALWSDLAGRAMQLEPDDIRATIRFTESGDGLRAASYEPIGSSPGPGDSVAAAVTERIYRGRRTPDPDKHPDLARLDAGVADFIRAVAKVASLCISGQPCTDWDEAVHHANLLDQGPVRAALDVGAKVEHPINDAIRALDKVQAVHDRHCPHVAGINDKLLTEEFCLSHARIGDYERERYGSLRVCSHCYDMLRRAGLEPTVAHKDPDLWPSIAMLRAHADMELTGKRVAYQRERTAWLNSLPIQRSA